ncbi:hypothetical protein PG997_007519 [Apiospora hydei]|uniref:Peptidase S8/S53 domain-containing protein n=1 Tax=Apiospora hydei TaxID=1337664 RepID=A0ABR1WB02_9PEZI
MVASNAPEVVEGYVLLRLWGSIQGSDQGCPFSREPNWKKPMCLQFISLTQAAHGTDRYKKAETSIENGLLAISSGDQEPLKDLIAHVEKLTPHMDDSLDFTEGYDPDTPFFLRRERRIIAWKDWVDQEPLKTPTDLENAERVAEAIDWAQRECKADLISISFGYMEDQPPIAAANSGANTTQLFPARHKSVISIRATTSKGYIADFNPPLDPDESTALATLGVEVPSAPPSHFITQRTSVKSGTSIANAIGVGIAGMLLAYVNQQSNRRSYNDVRKEIYTRKGLLGLDALMSTGWRTGEWVSAAM